jgi:hypothetical protein
MFPYIIAGAIGFAVAKLFEEDEAPKYAHGGSVLLAPNGKPSNLTPEQYKLVRTPAFKSWFGDWENDPANASKVIDENGEPLVVYHGTYLKEGKVWTEMKNVHYFTDNINTAIEYPKADYYFYETFDEYVEENGLEESDIEQLSEEYDIEKLKKGSVMAREDDWFTIWENYDPNKMYVYKCFLNLINPLIIEDAHERDMTSFHYTRNQKDEKEKGFDGVIGIYPYRWFNDDIYEYRKNKQREFIKEKHFVTFYNNQIKLADGSNTTFDGSNPDIRFDGGGEITTYTEFYDNLQIEDGSKYIGQKFANVFPFIGKKTSPAQIRISVKEYNNLLGRLENDNYTTKGMKTADLNRLEKRQKYIDKKKYLSRFYLDPSGTIIGFDNSDND